MRQKTKQSDFHPRTVLPPSGENSPDSRIMLRDVWSCAMSGKKIELFGIAVDSSVKESYLSARVMKSQERFCENPRSSEFQLQLI